MGEKAEREKNELNDQLLHAQREKVNVEGEKAKLVVQKASDIRVVEELNSSINGMNEKLKGLTTTKTKTDEEILTLTSRIDQLTQLLATTDKQVKVLRETKTQVLSILSTLKTVRNNKLADLVQMEATGKDVVDLLEDINETMNGSVNTLIQTTCTPSFRQFHPVESSLEGTMSNTEAKKGKVSDHDELKRRRRWIPY